MSTKTTVEITAASGATAWAEVEIESFWIQSDTWKRTNGALNTMPASGNWENRAFNGSTSQVRMKSFQDLEFDMMLDGFKNVSVGSQGTGEFHGRLYMFQDKSTINWKVTKII